MKKLLSEYPKLLREWHPSKNGDLKPDEFTYGSIVKVWWLCSKGHSYNTRILSRTSSKTGCPYCSGHRVGKDNNLKVLFPKIATEWHPKKNGDLKPEDFPGSSNKKVWWLCPIDHSYDARIYNRTINKSGCPHC